MTAPASRGPPSRPTRDDAHPAGVDRPTNVARERPRGGDRDDPLALDRDVPPACAVRRDRLPSPNDQVQHDSLPARASTGLGFEPRRPAPTIRDTAWRRKAGRVPAPALAARPAAGLGLPLTNVRPPPYGAPRLAREPDWGYGMPTSWLELNRAHLLHNLAGLRKLVEPARIMAVVKGNAYGAGAVPIARVLAAAGVDAFAVANVPEAVELREGGIAGTILCLTYFTPDEIEPLLGHDLRPAVFTLDAARGLAGQARASGGRARVWIKVDTGLGRLGVHFQEAGAFIREVARQPHLDVEGLFTTLSENPERDPIQVERLLEVRSRLPELGSLALSAASSVGILSLRESCLDVVRPGITLLGLEPSARERLDLALVREADLRPVVTWKTRVGYVKVVPRGEQVGYGMQPPLERDTRVATLTIGWADGYAWGMAKTGEVLIRRRRCPVLSVSANSTMVDATNVSGAAIGDEVVLLGRQGNEEIPAAEIARVVNGVYRMLIAIPRSVPRDVV